MCDLRQDTCLFGHGRVDPARTQVSPGVFGAFLHCDKCDKNPRILSGIQFTMYFIGIFVVETKRFVGSFVHVILTRQTCGQRSSRAAESKRRAIGNYFSKRICYMFPISKCRGDWDLGLCTYLSLENRSAMAKSDFSYVKTRFFPGFCHRAAVLQRK